MTTEGWSPRPPAVGPRREAFTRAAYAYRPYSSGPNVFPQRKSIRLLLGASIAALTVSATPALAGDVDIGDQYVPELDITYFFTDKIAAELSSDDEDIDTNMPRKNDDASDFASRRAAACMTALSHDSMFESALESALDTGKCTQEQLDELNGLKLAFDAFAKAAIDAKAAINAKDTKLIKFLFF